MAERRKYNFLYLTYRAALKGDTLAANFLIGLAISFLERKTPLPSGLGRFFVSKLKDPEEFYRITTYKPKAKRGRPSIDDDSIAHRVGLKMKRRLGPTRSQENAMIVAYLVSQGHPINEVGADDKESAVVLLSELIGRSVRSIQNDYYKHRGALKNRESSLHLGESYLHKRRVLRDLRKKHRGT